MKCRYLFTGTLPGVAELELEYPRPPRDDAEDSDVDADSEPDSCLDMLDEENTTALADMGEGEGGDSARKGSRGDQEPAAATTLSGWMATAKSSVERRNPVLVKLTQLERRLLIDRDMYRQRMYKGIRKSHSEFIRKRFVFAKKQIEASNKCPRTMEQLVLDHAEQVGISCLTACCAVAFCRVDDAWLSRSTRVCATSAVCCSTRSTTGTR